MASTPPERAEVSGTYPNPSNAVARIGFGKMWDTLFGTNGLLSPSGDVSATGYLYSGGAYGLRANGFFDDGSGFASQLLTCDPNVGQYMALQGYHAPNSWYGMRMTLDVAGSPSSVIQFRAAGGGQIFANGVQLTSDRRLKTDIEQIDGALDKLCTLTGYTYRRTDFEDVRHMGLIAQELQVVAPESVRNTGDEQGTLTVSHAAVNALIVQAIKELRAEVQALKEKIG